MSARHLKSDAEQRRTLPFGSQGFFLNNVVDIAQVEARATQTAATTGRDTMAVFDSLCVAEPRLACARNVGASFQSDAPLRAHAGPRGVHVQIIEFHRELIVTPNAACLQNGRVSVVERSPMVFYAFSTLAHQSGLMRPLRAYIDLLGACYMRVLRTSGSPRLRAPQRPSVRQLYYIFY